MLNDYFTGPPNSFRAQTVLGAVADGIYLTVGPLSPGAHTLRWHVQKRDGSAQQDDTYQLTVP